MTYVMVYFITSGAVLIALDGWFVLPFIIWFSAVCGDSENFYSEISIHCGTSSRCPFLNDRRVTDRLRQYYNRQTLLPRLREAGYAKRSMQEFMVTVHAQMRLATSLETLTYLTNILLTLSTRAVRIMVMEQRLRRRWCDCDCNCDGFESE